VAFAVTLGALALFHPALSVSLRLALAATTGIVGALVELYSGRVDDNFSIPLGVALAAHVVLAIAAV
jgi:dolichol kinase